MHLDDTIVAISTPPGRGGLGVVRLAGPDARSIAAPLLRLKSGLEPNRAVFGELIEPGTQQRIDEVVVTFFAKPHSYTTDDIVEISAHGSPVVLRHIVELALARGARLADPGEFTLRAFLNGRLDLTQAEAVRDLIDSQTLYQARVAAQQLGGALSHLLSPIKQKLVELIATLEAGVDFAEDDVSVLPGPQILARIESVAAPLRELCRSFAYGKLVHEGLTLAIVGRPNVGKSSLFNCLVERERAIVTAAPGTTRDLVTETVAIGGIPVHLVDTAGIRQAPNEAEAEAEVHRHPQIPRGPRRRRPRARRHRRLPAPHARGSGTNRTGQRAHRNCGRKQSRFGRWPMVDGRWRCIRARLQSCRKACERRSGFSR